jgi:hypothetical protein
MDWLPFFVRDFLVSVIYYEDLIVTSVCVVLWVVFSLCMILSLSCEWINILSSTTMIWIFPLHNFIQYWYLLILFQMVIRLRISLPWLNFNLSESSVKSLLKTGCSKRNVESLIKFRRSEASEYGLWFVFTLKSKLDFHAFTYWIMIFHGSCCTRDHVYIFRFSRVTLPEKRPFTYHA